MRIGTTRPCMEPRASLLTEEAPVLFDDEYGSKSGPDKTLPELA